MQSLSFDASHLSPFVDLLAVVASSVTILAEKRPFAPHNKPETYQKELTYFELKISHL
jgi:hypothetical protein